MLRPERQFSTSESVSYTFQLRILSRAVFTAGLGIFPSDLARDPTPPPPRTRYLYWKQQLHRQKGQILLKKYRGYRGHKWQFSADSLTLVYWHKERNVMKIRLSTGLEYSTWPRMSVRGLKNSTLCRSFSSGPKLRIPCSCSFFTWAISAVATQASENPTIPPYSAMVP